MKKKGVEEEEVNFFFKLDGYHDLFKYLLFLFLINIFLLLFLFVSFESVELGPGPQHTWRGVPTTDSVFLSLFFGDGGGGGICSTRKKKWNRIE